MGQTFDTKYTVNYLPPYTLGVASLAVKALSSIYRLHRQRDDVYSLFDLIEKKTELTCYEEQESQTSDKEKHLMKDINETKLSECENLTSLKECISNYSSRVLCIGLS